MSKSPQANQMAIMASLIGQVGCVTGLAAIIIIAISFGIGRFLDYQFEAGGIFTVLLMVGSFPITLFVMVKISLIMVNQAQQRVEAAAQREKEKEETQR